MNGIKRYLCLTLLVIMIISVLVTESYAVPFKATPNGDEIYLELASGPLMVPRIKTDAKTYMIVRYQFQGKAIPGANFKIWRVADVDDFCKFTAIDPFIDCEYTENLNQNDQESWKAMAHNLKQWVAKQGIEPNVTGKTDSVNGDIVFSEANKNMLLPGLYLLVGEPPTIIGDYTYSSAPAMIYLPEINMKDNDWEYGTEADPVIIKPKGERGDDPDVDTKLKVIKTWEEYGYTDKRPESITVELLKNGKIERRAELSEKNDWRYTFENLPVNEDGKWNEWTLDEVYFDDNYRSEITREGITYIVKNTYTGELPPGDPTPVLPNTGLLWWPVPVLAGLGVLFIVLGAGKRRKTEE